MKKLFITLALLIIAVPAFASFQQNTQSEPYKYKFINTNATNLIKSGAGILHTITVTGGTAGTIVVYDNTAGSGTQIASFSSTNALASYSFDIGFTSGCTVVTGGATNVTVSYQ